MHDLPEILTVAEVASRIKCSRPHAYRLIRDGDIPSVKMAGAHRSQGGGSRIVHEQAIELYRLGKRRGEYEAVIGYGRDRRRKNLRTSSKPDAERMLDEMNVKLLTGDQTSVASILALHRHDLGDRYDRAAQRLERHVVAFFGDSDISTVTPRRCRQYTKEPARGGYGGQQCPIGAGATFKQRPSMPLKRRSSLSAQP